MTTRPRSVLFANLFMHAAAFLQRMQASPVQMRRYQSLTPEKIATVQTEKTVRAMMKHPPRSWLKQASRRQLSHSRRYRNVR